jgi:16S rRNA (cytosine1402-N4)-methyltransferase
MTDKIASPMGLRPKESVHKAVLLQETIEGLNLPSSRQDGSPKSLVMDCTFGGGGHSAEICKKYPGVKIIALDQDKSVFEKAKKKFKDLNCDITFINANFRDLDKYLQGSLLDAIIFDLGLSSDQLLDSGRGFSFMHDEPLLMTMKENPTQEDLTALDVVNTWGEKSLADIIYGYGEERYSRKIARAIVDARKKTRIQTTTDLVKIIGNAVPAVYRKGRLHFATKTFQALRIAVNDELGVLRTGLRAGFEALKIGGRMSVISFHSLEDRIIKQFFKEMVREGRSKLINKKPILAGKEELKNNPRSRSAKLRILEKIK